jgi:hypothetical protein
VKTMLATAAVVLSAALASAQQTPPAPACEVHDPCQAPRRLGETAVIFLGDSGYGPGGASEWGPHAQGAVAHQMQKLCPRPDLIFFLGDNVYWKGSPDLFAPRFDTMYRYLFDADNRRVHAALGNHDVKGCQVSRVPGFDPGQTCADSLARLIREDVARDAPAGAVSEAVRAQQEEAVLVPDVLSRAAAVSPLDCPPAFDSAYEQDQMAGGEQCYATQALSHTPFGYLQKAGNPLRFYTVDWPPPGKPDPALEGPKLRVLVADSNTLRAHASLLPPPHEAGEGRSDRLQVLWIENQLRTSPDAWRFVILHHPAFSPKGCVFKLFGTCVGGHADEPALHAQLLDAYGIRRAEGEAPSLRSHASYRPDVVMAAHNHFYARSLPLDALGYPARAEGDGIRYFITGGGGAPLYRLQPLHSRYARGQAVHHFTYWRFRGDEAFFWVIDSEGQVHDSGCFRRGDNGDRCIASGTHTSDVVTCGEAPALAKQACPAPRP